ncbi:MAG: CPBP family intramembrane metalloprotease [Acidimicrobiia bacterium]|nr:CPBP family intramembrane metalloprotease [Acidimicrobiia bacterium]MDH3463583.1 CPBP family intramembrane metalloprotease [Acidimicrobiia bacterium]
MAGSRFGGIRTEELQVRRLSWFLLLAFGLPWSFWWLLILEVITVPGLAGQPDGDIAVLTLVAIVPLLLAAQFGPAIAGLGVTGFTEGRVGVGGLLARLYRLWFPLRWLLVALVIFPVMRVVAGVSLMAVGSDSSAVTMGSIGAFAVAVIGESLFSGIGEEIGFRGYLLPRLQSRWNALQASVILGVIWGVWHLPLSVFPGQSQEGQAIWWMLCWQIVVAVIFTWIYNVTGGSLLAVALLHGSANAASELVLLEGVSETQLLIVFAAVAAFIVLLFGSSLEDTSRLRKARSRMMSRAHRGDSAESHPTRGRTP